MLEQKTWCSSCCANSNPPWATVLTAFHISSNKMAFLLACGLYTATMSGLCPPVPTELVSVFYLTTGSVQQEQECSLKTGRICVRVASSSLNAGKQPSLLCLFYIHSRTAWGVPLESLALIYLKKKKAKLTCQMMVLSLEVYASLCISSYCPKNMNVVYADSVLSLIRRPWAIVWILLYADAVYCLIPLLFLCCQGPYWD